jgi:isopropylmalate/homocitrate/citramalate synthase
MEAGMKSFPASLPTKERWIKIAETVEGKTPKQCFDRFKSIVAKLKAEGPAK